ncbi:hypothetical protein GRI89_09525 [Altererythrobacter salegens]|uniref:UrcA family protein n=1 Tax=Croceibacterium salegens TaxID=1737568 RepID=A0A6I4SWB5_9SPHN|nr:hypothetical protein [Croceibacterium salegens]MXO59778.1 hypothetical protein [Croceibacterium salegens]
MKTILTAALAASVLCAAPASAQTMLLVIGERPVPQQEVDHHATLDEKIELALDQACEKPFVRDLKGWQLYKDCRTEVRSEIDEQLAKAGTPDAVTIALR